MRYQRVLTIAAASAIGLALLPVSMRGASGDRTPPGPILPARSASAPVALIGGSLEEDRLSAQARHAAAAAVVSQEARDAREAREARQAQQARDLAARRARAARSSRSAARPRPAPASAPSGPDDVWARLRRCEAGGNYTRNSGNGYFGAYQFSAATWRGLGYPGLPHQAPPAVQDEAARKLQRRSGWGQWPACSRRIGVR
jgi:hypothetical protein